MKDVQNENGYYKKNRTSNCSWDNTLGKITSTNSPFNSDALYPQLQCNKGKKIKKSMGEQQAEYLMEL